MGLVKNYKKYVAAGVFGLVGSSQANVIYLQKGKGNKIHCAVGACEDVIIWDLKTAEKVHTLKGDKVRHDVTVLGKSPDERFLAVGYRNGMVFIFDLSSPHEPSIMFHCHTSAVLSLSYDHTGIKLASGSQDTLLKLYDVVGESGHCTLKGHKGSVTQVRFLTRLNVLISSSKDTYIRFWDINTQHCFRILTGHRTEIYDFILSKDERLLITGSADMELRVWEILFPEDLEGKNLVPDAKLPKLTSEEEFYDYGKNDDAYANVLRCTKLGSVMRRGKKRVVSLTVDSTGRFFGCHGNDQTLELFVLLTDDEIKKRLRKREKKLKRKAKEAGFTDDSEVTKTLKDKIQPLTEITLSCTIRAFDLLFDSRADLKVLSHLTNNSLDMFRIDVNVNKPQAVKSGAINMAGHRTDVRTVSFSTDSTAVLSGSGDSILVWNRISKKCIRAMSCEYALCSEFMTGDHFVVIGTKSGKLQLFDIASSTLVESIDAHTAEVWTIHLSPNKRQVISGSADNTLKVWDLELVKDETYSKTSKRLTLINTRTVQFDDEVLSVRFSPDQRLVATALGDYTVKTFFADTFKLHLNMYSHVLPVLCLDISTDSKLIVTGSHDRNIKVSGLDFGDVHRSILAHNDSIKCVKFIPFTHLFFSCGVDGKIKQWDGDTFERIITLEGHRSTVWNMAISPCGNFVATGGHDRSIRLWEKSRELLELGEEKEKEREREDEEEILKGADSMASSTANKETTVAGRKTIESKDGADRIMLAIELYKKESAEVIEYVSKELPMETEKLSTVELYQRMSAYGVSSPEKYVLEIIKQVKISELEVSLEVIPFDYIEDLLKIFNRCVSSGWDSDLCVRCVLILLRNHHSEVTMHQSLTKVLEDIKDNASKKIKQEMNTVGFNLEGLKYMMQEIASKDDVSLFADATGRLHDKRKKEKRKALWMIRT